MKGGRWALDIDSQDVPTFLNFYWLGLLLSLVTERYGKLDENICGAVVRVRRKGCKVKFVFFFGIFFYSELVGKECGLSQPFAFCCFFLCFDSGY